MNMEAIREFMAMPITWGSWMIVTVLIPIALMIAIGFGVVIFCKVKGWIRHKRILKEEQTME